MKKKFMMPVLKRHEIQNKENIIASRTWNDGVVTATWHFVHTEDSQTGTYVSPDAHDAGCFDMLISFFATNGAYKVEKDWHIFLTPISDENYPNYQTYLSCSSKYVKPTGSTT